MNFTPRCNRSIDRAKASLAAFNHPCVSSAHLVFGILELGDGVAVNVLRNFGVSPDSVQRYLSKLQGSLHDVPMQDGSLIGKSAQLAFKRAEAAAAKFDHTYVGTKHLLMAIVIEEKGHAADLFAALHVDKAAVGKEVFKEL